MARGHRLLLRLFPRARRERNGEALIGALLDAAGPEVGRIRPADAADLVRCAAVLRARALRATFSPSGTPGAVLLAGLLIGLLTAVVLVTGPAGGALSPEFLATSLIVILVPGTGVVFTISTTLAGGWRHGAVAAAGSTIAIIPHVLAAVLGLSGLMEAGAAAFEVVWWAGVAYLLFVGVAMIRERGAVGIEAGGAPPRTAGVIVRRAMLLNLLNPKLTLFFFAFLPQFLDGPSGIADPRLIQLGAVFMIVTPAGFLAYAALTAAARNRLLETPRVRVWLQRSLGALLVGFAARLAVSDR